MLNIKTQYRYSCFSILLPADHLLPAHQKRHRLYDRFLPQLSKYLKPQSAVIDVGANCGDTLAGMCDANNKLNFICVEPDEVFFKLLQENISRIKEGGIGASIKAVKALVGKSVNNVSLGGSNGTKKAMLAGAGKSALSSQSLDHILSREEALEISLIKSDVDGFDYDVIDSAAAAISSHLPILFFECQFDHEYQKNAYEKTLASLELKHYKNWVLFDNFGEVVLRTQDLGQVYQLFDYVWRQNIGRSTRTIYYYDILGFTEKDQALIDKAINDYLKV